MEENTFINPDTGEEEVNFKSMISRDNWDTISESKDSKFSIVNLQTKSESKKKLWWL